MPHGAQASLASLTGTDTRLKELLPHHWSIAEGTRYTEVQISVSRGVALQLACSKLCPLRTLSVTGSIFNPTLSVP